MKKPKVNKFAVVESRNGWAATSKFTSLTEALRFAGYALRGGSKEVKIRHIG